MFACVLSEYMIRTSSWKMRSLWAPSLRPMSESSRRWKCTTRWVFDQTYAICHLTSRNHQLSKPVVTEKDVQDVQDGLAKANIRDSELGKLQQKQRAAVARAVVRSNSNTGIRSPSTTRERGPSAPREGAHDDLRDLSFGRAPPSLQAPIRPSRADDSSGDERPVDRRGSLSDFSDHASSDEEAHTHWASRDAGAGSRTPYRSTGWDTGSRSASKARAYAGLPEESEDNLPRSAGKKKAVEEDPFADPFAD